MPHPWIAKGIEAVNLVDPRVGERYCCPLCLRLFKDHIDLSIEHAPPVGAGGASVAFTCRECNSRAGHELEHHLATNRRLARFVEGKATLDIGLEVAGHTINGTATLEDDTFSIVGAPTRTDPTAQAAVVGELQRIVRERESEWGGTIHFRVGSYDAHRERVAWLKSAYMVAFAVFGYRYILRPVLEPVRDQIQNPDTTGVAGLTFFDRKGVKGARQLVILRRPEWLKSLLVVMDNCHVYLPDFSPHPNFWSALETRIGLARTTPGTTEFGGDLVPWPTEPRFLLDFQRSRGSATS